MRYRLLFFFSLCLVLPPFVACYNQAPFVEDSGDFAVKMAFSQNPDKGAKVDDPRDVSRFGEILTLEVTARKPDGSTDTAYDGQLCVYATKGVLEGGTKPFRLNKGVITDLKLRLRLAYGRTTLWVGEIKKSPDSTEEPLCPNEADPDDKTVPYLGKSGASRDVYYQLLSIQDVQEVDASPHNSPLYKKQVIIGRGDMIVTYVTNNGFYVTDLEARKTGKGFDSIFVFTFSAPTLIQEDTFVPKVILAGDRIFCLQGGIDEFSGHTQLAFPSFTPIWKNGTPVCGRENDKDQEIANYPPDKIPPPIEIKTLDIWNRNRMEPYEATLVEIKNAIPLPFSTNQDGWQQFRQWPLLWVEATTPDKQKSCEAATIGELEVYQNSKEFPPGQYRPCLRACFQTRKVAEEACAPNDTICRTKVVDAWYTCFFACRQDRNTGLFKRLEEQGCAFGIILAVSSGTVPEFDPSLPDSLQIRFSSVKGVLQQVKASSFFELTPDQFPDEQSNNGFVLLIRDAKDLAQAPR